MKAEQSKQWLLATAILFLILLAYQPVWHAGFVWDDGRYVTENQSLRSVEGLRRIWIKPGSTIQYYPLVFTSFWAEYHLWKLQPLGYHLVNILLHALNAVLLWRVLRRLDVPGAWLAAAIFAIHPVTVESVAWITERKNVLSCLFYLLAALAFLRFRPLTDAKADRAWDWRFYPMLLVAFLCALFSKTVTCTLPAALLLVVWWKTGRIEKRDVLATAPLFVLGLALGLVTVQMEKHAGASGSEWTLSFVQRGLLAGRALWFYASKLLWPRNLTFIYPHWEIDAGAAWQYSFPIAAVALVVALWWLRARIGKGPVAAVLFFAGTLGPALGFFDLYPFRYSYVADHFQYVACIGLIVLAVSAGVALCRRIGGQTQGVAALAAATLLTALGSAAWHQAHVYRDLETLWRHTLVNNPGCWMAHNNLAAILIPEGRTEEAVRHCELALQIKPDFAEAHSNLGLILERLGKHEDAIGQYEQALRFMPNLAVAHYGLGIVLLHVGRVQEAMAHCQQALRINPDYAEAHYGLGLALEQAGKVREANVHYEQALRINPDYPEVQNNLAWLLATRAPSEGGDPVRAVTLADQACKLTDNRVAQYLDTLAAAYAATGRFDDAVATAQKAIELARSAGQLQVATQVEPRLELYRAGRPYLQPIDVARPHSP